LLSAFFRKFTIPACSTILPNRVFRNSIFHFLQLLLGFAFPEIAILLTSIIKLPFLQPFFSNPAPAQAGKLPGTFISMLQFHLIAYQ